MVTGGKLVPANVCIDAQDPELDDVHAYEKTIGILALRPMPISRPSSSPGSQPQRPTCLRRWASWCSTGLRAWSISPGRLGALAAFVSWTIVATWRPGAVGWSPAYCVDRGCLFFYGRVLAPRLAYSDPVMRAVATLSFALILLGFIGYVWGELPRQLRAAD